MSMLADPQLAVYRPWVWIQIGELMINYPMGEDEKFGFLKDFRWSIGETYGSGVEFTLFDNSPQSYTKDWFSFLRTNIVDEKNLRIYFQWGVAGRKQNGAGVRGVPSNGGPYISQIHEMTMTGVNMEYVEGGANYKFNGQDSFAITQAVTSFDRIKNATFEEAVIQMIQLLQKDDILPSNFDVEYSNDVRRFFPQIFTVKRDWPCLGFPFLLTIQKWMFEIHSDQNIDKPDNLKVGWVVHPITIKGKVGLHFKSANYISDEMKSDLDIHINPPNAEQSSLGTGRHTAISFRPEFNSSAYWSMFPQLSKTDSMTRSIVHSGDGGAGVNLLKGAGNPSPQSGQSVDDPIRNKQAADAVRSGSAGAAANDGSLFVPSGMEVELLGIPNIDEISYLGKTVKLTVWNTAYLNIGGRDHPVTGVKSIKGGWSRTPPIDNRWPPEMKIVGINHYISTEGVYTTSLRLTPCGTGTAILTNQVSGSAR